MALNGINPNSVSALNRVPSNKQLWRVPGAPSIAANGYMCASEYLPIKYANEYYQLVGSLGQGSFGSVVMAKLKSKYVGLIADIAETYPRTMMYPLACSHRARTDIVAIKIMNRRLESVQDYSRVKEVAFIMSIPSHPCLLQVYDLFIDKASFKLHIVLESMDQNLYQLMKARKTLFSSRTLKSILSQLLAAIGHIHAHGFFHRDIKPENILIMPAFSFYGTRSRVPDYMRGDCYVVKLADYGLGRREDCQQLFTTYVSTRWYRSPEILLRASNHSYEVDIWAFGCVVSEAACFSPLFPGHNELDQIWRILETLGCPDYRKMGPAPIGGFWSDAEVLSQNLGFSLPAHQGWQLPKLLRRSDLPASDFGELIDLIQCCLQWDPMMRPPAGVLANKSYFDHTSLRDSKMNPHLAAKRPNSPLYSTFVPTCVQGSTCSVGINEEYLYKKHGNLRRLPHMNMEQFNTYKASEKKLLKSTVPVLEPAKPVQPVDENCELTSTEWMEAVEDLCVLPPDLEVNNENLPENIVVLEDDTTNDAATKCGINGSRKNRNIVDRLTGARYES